MEQTGQKMERLKEVMTLREASQYLGISPDTLYKYLGEKSIPAFKLGNRWRFKKDLLDRWIERKIERTELVTESKPKRLVKSTVKRLG
jgi:excisionase family DNA binding protein